MQQLQLELRQLQQTLMIKQDELTQLNRDNARLLAEARQQQKDLQAQQRQLEHQEQTLVKERRTLMQAEKESSALRERCDKLQGEVGRLSEAKDTQGQQVQSLQERLLEALMQLKLLNHPPADTGNTDHTRSLTDSKEERGE